MKYIINFLTILTLSTFINFECVSQNTLFTNDFESSLNWQTASSSSCSYSWERTSLEASSGNYSLKYDSYNADAGCVSYLVTPTFNLSDIRSDDSLAVDFFFYKSSNFPGAGDYMKIHLINANPNGDDQIIHSSPEIHRYYGNFPQENNEGWHGYTYFVKGHEIMGQTNSNTFYYIFEAVSDYGESMYLDDLNIQYFEGAPLNLVQPNGGEKIEYNHDYNIRWSADNSINEINIDFSEDNGENWNTIATNVNASNNSYTWDVPSITTSEGLIRIRAENSNVSAVSASTFSIMEPVPVITINQPTAYSELDVATETAIEWESDLVDRVDIEYSTNAGNNWAPIVQDFPASDATFKWLVPNEVTSGYDVMVRVISSKTQNVGDTVSNLRINEQNFKVIKINQPVEGETFEVGSQVNIEWVANDLVKTVSVQYSLNGGTNWNDLAPSINAHQYEYQWNLPQKETDEAFVRIIDSANQSIQDKAGPFSIANTTGLTERKTENMLDIFPNPAEDKLNINFLDDIQDPTLKVINAQGKVMKSLSGKEINGKTKIQLNIQNLTSGVYFLRFNTNDRNFTKKFLKQ